MKRTTIWIGLLFLTLSVLATSCRKKQHIIISKASMTYSYSGGNDVFRVEADCNWEVVGVEDWLTVNPTVGNKDGNVVVSVERNNTMQDRRATLFVVSENGKVKKGIEIIQASVDINAIINKVWFALTDERWDTDYYNQVIPESYRSYSYYSNPGYENWFFYFLNNNTGYQVRTYNGDTIYYPYNFIYYPDVDSLDISFEIIGDTVNREDYHAIVHQLDEENFVISHAYRPHQFEKIVSVNVTGNRKEVFKVNPKKIQSKPKGPLIPVK